MVSLCRAQAQAQARRRQEHIVPSVQTLILIEKQVLSLGCARAQALGMRTAGAYCARRPDTNSPKRSKWRVCVVCRRKP